MLIVCNVFTAPPCAPEEEHKTLVYGTGDFDVTASTTTPSDAVRGSERSVKLGTGMNAWILVENALPPGHFKMTAFAFAVNNVARAIVTVSTKTTVLSEITVGTGQGRVVVKEMHVEHVHSFTVTCNHMYRQEQQRRYELRQYLSRYSLL